MLEKTEGQSRMDSSQKLEILGTQDTGRRQTKEENTTQKTKKMSNTDRTKNPGVNPDARVGQAALTCYSYSQYVLDTTISKQNEPSYKQLDVKTNRTSLKYSKCLSGNYLYLKDRKRVPKT